MRDYRRKPLQAWGPCFAEHIRYNECLSTLVGKSSSGLDQLQDLLPTLLQDLYRRQFDLAAAPMTIGRE
jgi:hypothetical protein